jgi:hypothetical protein
MRIILSLALLTLPFLAMAQLTPEQVEARRKSGFKLVEWRDDNGNIQLISADSAATLQAKRNGNNENNGNNNANNGNNNANNGNNNANNGNNKPAETISYRYYYETSTATGEQVIVEEKEITSTTMVERNNQIMQKKSSRKELSVTNFRCLPVEPANWKDFATALSALAASNTKLDLMRSNWKAYLADKPCLPPFVIAELLQSLPVVEYKEAFVADIYATCPDTKQAEILPFVPAPVVVVVEKPKVVIEPDPIEPPIILTPKQLKAKQKEEMKAAKAAEKAAKAEAKAKAKAEKAAAKAAAKK